MSQGFTTEIIPSPGEGHVTVICYHYSGITQGTWAPVANSGQVLCFYFRNSTNAQNDQVDYKAYLAAGTYTFHIIGLTGPNNAIMTVLLDAVSLGTLDWYAAGGAFNTIQTITGIVVSTSGLKTISLKAATRNGSSGGWYLDPSSFALFRTA